MPMHVLPEKVIKDWDDVKHKLIPAIEKLSGPMMTSDFKKTMKTTVESLFKEFESGLKQKMKSANKAKTNQEAKAALGPVLAAARSYRQKVAAKRQATGPVDGRAIFDIIDKALKAIEDTSSALLRAIG